MDSGIFTFVFPDFVEVQPLILLSVSAFMACFEAIVLAPFRIDFGLLLCDASGGFSAVIG